MVLASRASSWSERASTTVEDQLGSLPTVGSQFHLGPRCGMQLHNQTISGLPHWCDERSLPSKCRHTHLPGSGVAYLIQGGWGLCMPGIGFTPNLLHVGHLTIPSRVKWCRSNCTPPVPKPLGAKSGSAGMVTLGVLGVPALCRGCHIGGGGGVDNFKNPGAVPILAYAGFDSVATW